MKKRAVAVGFCLFSFSGVHYWGLTHSARTRDKDLIVFVRLCELGTRVQCSFPLWASVVMLRSFGLSFLFWPQQGEQIFVCVTWTQQTDCTTIFIQHCYCSITLSCSHCIYNHCHRFTSLIIFSLFFLRSSVCPDLVGCSICKYLSFFYDSYFWQCTSPFCSLASSYFIILDIYGQTLQLAWSVSKHAFSVCWNESVML